MKITKIGNQSIQLPRWRRVVIKVGSALVAPEGRRMSTRYSLEIASFITEMRNRNNEVILVTSGAVAAGRSTQPRLPRRPLSIQEKQALAAIGQPLLMEHWSRFFDFPCAQLLLTYQGIYDRHRFLNARNTLHELLQRKTLPIVNENDTVITDELKVGDNDNLAAHVAVLANADVLVICSDVDGLYDSNPRTNPKAELIPIVEKIDSVVLGLAGETGNAIATGGMRTKVEAAQKATERGIHTIIINGTSRDCFEKLMHGELHGTIFLKKATPLTAKKHWMLHAMPTSGRLHIDDGARLALLKKGASLLPSGIQKVHGNFTQGDAVGIVSRGEIIAKGITQYDARDLRLIIGKKSTEIETILGFVSTEEIVHRDDMVLIKE